MSVSLLIALALVGAALLWAVLVTLQVYEHKRYVCASLRTPAYPWQVPPGVLVCVPCKGLELDLVENLRCVLSQDYPKYRVRFVVESAADAACAVIQRLMSTTSVPCELLVAGSSSDSGQKVHNLRYATAELPDDVEVLAFFDSDAKPAPDALARLVGRVCRGKRRVATGYRWFVPRRPSLANVTLASINAGVASLFKREGWNLIWGGSWAVTRELFEKSALADAWRGTLSDDLVASRVLRRAGATVVFEPGCMAASSIDVTWKEAVTFLRRQFVIGRCYAPTWWWTTFPLMVLQPLVLFGSLALAPVLAWQGNPNWFWPLLVGATLYGLAVVRGRLRQAAWSSRVIGAPDAVRAAARFECWAAPWTCLIVAGTMLSSAVGRSISWRGIEYHIGAAGRITLLGRVPDAEQHREMLAAHAQRLERDRAAHRPAEDAPTTAIPRLPTQENEPSASSSSRKKAA